MKKSKGTQEKKGEAAKGTPGKRTATKAKKEAEGTAGTEAGAAKAEEEGGARFISPVAVRLKDKEQLSLSDSEKVHEMNEAVRVAYSKSGKLSDIRWILSTAKFDGFCLRMILNMEKERLTPVDLIAREMVCTPNEFIAEWKEEIDRQKKSSTRKIEKDDLDSENTYLERVRSLYNDALEAFHKDDEGKSLISYLRKNSEGNNTIIIDLAANEKDDSIYSVNWKCKMKGRATMIVHLRPTVKARLEKSISALHQAGLLDGIGGTATNVIEEALLSMIDLMEEFRVPPSDIWMHAQIALRRAKRGDKLFTQEEVRRLIHEDDEAKRWELYDKMRDYKTEKHRAGFPDE